MHDVMLGNLLAAAALQITDAVDRRIGEVAGRGRSAVSALAALHFFGPLSASAIARQLHLSQPAMARLVQGLEANGLCRRVDVEGKAVPLRLTPAGTALVEQSLGARGHLVEIMVDALDEPEREQLARLLDKLLTAGFAETPDARYVCRLCDRDRCGDAESRCPVGRAAEERTAERGGR